MLYKCLYGGITFSSSPVLTSIITIKYKYFSINKLKTEEIYETYYLSKSFNT